MKANFLLVALFVITLSSCSTTYRSGQTPDDVYFSPLKNKVEEKKENNEEEVNNKKSDENEEAQIRAKINNRNLRLRDSIYNIKDYSYDRYDDDYYSYGYTKYPYRNVNYNNGYYGYNNNCNCNCYNNPKQGYYIKPKTTTIETPRRVNLEAYATGETTISTKTGTVKTTKVNRTYNNSNEKTVVGKIIDVISGNNSNTETAPSRNTNTSDNRNYTPSNSTPSSSGSSSTPSSSSSSSSNSRPSRG